MRAKFAGRKNSLLNAAEDREPVILPTRDATLVSAATLERSALLFLESAMISFCPDPQDEALTKRVEDFVREVVIPFETDPRNTAHGPTEDLRRELNALARTAGCWPPMSRPSSAGWG